MNCKFLTRIFLGATLVGGSLLGCSTSAAVKTPVKVYKVGYRQSPPQPAYNRTRWVHLPEPVPARELAATSHAALRPVIHLDLKDATLEEAAKTLAASNRYTSYCANTIATKKINVDTLGTIDELGQSIAKSAGIDVVVDHDLKEVRFLAKGAEAPKFFETGSSGVKDEHKSTN